MSRSALNLELKVRCEDLPSLRARLKFLDTHGQERQDQVDTYFNAPYARLKLREINGERAELISYVRSDEETARVSRYHVVDVADPTALKAALGEALGVRGEVRKVREVYLWKNVRIHLDEVGDLGSFLEFEALLSTDEPVANSAARLATLQEALGIATQPAVAGSYSDLLGI